MQQHALPRQSAPPARLCAPSRRRRAPPAPPPRAAKGFGAKRVPPKQAAAEVEDAEQLNVDLGRGKSLQLLRTRDLLDTGGPFVSSQAIHRLQALYGAGDVVWPASLALARLLAHCPSFCAGRRVIELGAGLGLVGSAAAATGATSLLLADRDGASLALAARSAALNAPALAAAGGISTLVADWAALEAWPPSGRIDLVLGSDILYDSSAAKPVAALLERYLKSADSAAADGVVRRALIADAPQREHRDAFVAACAAVGLDAQATVIPGPEGTMLLNVVVAA